MKQRLAPIGIALLATLTGTCCNRSTRPDGGTLTVSVAASLQNAMSELGPVFEASHPGVKLKFNFGGSGTLEQQIESGAPIDVFLSAAPKQMDALARKGLILPNTRRDLLRNEVVLIVPKDRGGAISFQDLADSQFKLIALGDPSSVPAGDYGRQVLEALHVWAAVQSKLVLGKDVRQVLSYVETGNADAGIVYATDAQDSGNVRVAAVAAADTHAPVIYPIAVIKDSQNPNAAKAFLTFLTGPSASKVFRRDGFTALAP